MKKIAAVVIALMLVISSVATVFAAQGPTIILGKASFSTAGEKKTVSIEGKDLEKIVVIQFTLKYDSTKFELQNISDGTESYAGTIPGAASNGIIPDATVGSAEAGKVTVIWESEKTLSGSGILAELEFSALTDDAGILELTVSTDADDDFSIRQSDESNIMIGEEVETEFVQKTYTVSGTVTSYLDETKAVTVGLYKGEETTPSYETTLTGNTGTYSISGVESGTYTMKVTKEKHVPAEYEIVVGTENVVQNIKLVLRGDVNGDGNINMTDVSLIRRYLVNSNNYPLTNRDAADINKDGNINMTDVSLIRRYLVNSTLYPIN